MKKFITILIAILIATTMALAVACDNGNNGSNGNHIYNWGAWAATQDATCTTAGIETRTCQNDNSRIETRPIAALG